MNLHTSGASFELSRAFNRSVITQFSQVTNRHRRIIVIVSPPRCSSTAFARMFWEQPSVRYYNHEPFELTYYQQRELESVVEKMAEPLDLWQLKHLQGDSNGNDLVIKEMPYQVGSRFPLLFSVATKPIIFLMRDPRLNISSRIKKKIVGGDSPIFPLIETGWQLLQEQISYCQVNNIPHLLVDSTDFRNFPHKIFSKLFAHFDYPYSNEMLIWNPCTQVRLDNLEGPHNHLYHRVLQSTGLQPATELIPTINDFPREAGYRQHVADCMQIYEELCQSPQRISAS